MIVMQKTILTIIAIVTGLCPIVLFMTKGYFDLMETLLCIICAIATMVYAQSAKESLLHKFAGWTLWSIVAYFLVILPSRLLGSMTNTVSFCTAGLLTYIFCVQASKVHIKAIYPFCAVALAILLVETPLRIVAFKTSIITLPEFFLYLFGAFGAFFFFRRKSFMTTTSLIVLTVFAVLFGLKGEHYWLNKLNYGTFTGRVERTPMKDYCFLDEQGDTVRLSDLRGKKLLIDCWAKSCGICRKKMPIVQQVYERYKYNDKVCVTSLYVIYRGESREEAVEIVKKQGCSFPVWTIDKSHELLVDLNITGYPTTLIIDEEGYLIFHGAVEDAGNLLE